MKQDDWRIQAANFLKAELASNGIDYVQLTEQLNSIGVDETYQAVAAKINRGTFSFAFFMQCMKAIGKTTINIEPK